MRRRCNGGANAYDVFDASAYRSKRCLPWGSANSSQAFNKVQYHVERQVRRFAAKQRKRTGFGWKRWSSDIVYGSWGLFRDYHLAYASAKARTDRTDS